MVVGILRGQQFSGWHYSCYGLLLDHWFHGRIELWWSLTVIRWSQVVKRLRYSCQRKVGIFVCGEYVDTGQALKYIVDLLHYRKELILLRYVPSWIRKRRRVNNMEADYVEADIPNEFVVGHGLDYKQSTVTFPYIGVLSPILPSTKQTGHVPRPRLSHKVFWLIGFNAGKPALQGPSIRTLWQKYDKMC